MVAVSSEQAGAIFLLGGLTLALPHRRFQDYTVKLWKLPAVKLPVWRFLEAAAWLYLALILMFACSSLGATRKALNAFDSRMGKEGVKETDYGSECDFKYAWERVDMFVAAHALGWFAKALVVRDVRMLWAMSIGFELTEVLLRPWLPNFNECWWDHLFYDLFTVNAAGILLGLKFADYLNLEVQDWYTGSPIKFFSYPGFGFPSVTVWPSWDRRQCCFCAAAVLLATVL